MKDSETMAEDKKSLNVENEGGQGAESKPTSGQDTSSQPIDSQNKKRQPEAGGTKKQSRTSATKVAYLGLLTAAAMILSYVESLFPVFAVPGMKLGLPNVAIVMVLYLYSWKEAVLVSVVRLLGVALLFGNTFSFLFSLSGAALSLLCMILAKKSGKLDTLGVSMIGGVTHNAGQIIAAMFLVENVRIGYYFFILAISGVLAGLVIGVIAGEMVKRMRRAIRKSHR